MQKSHVPEHVPQVLFQKYFLGAPMPSSGNPVQATGPGQSGWTMKRSKALTRDGKLKEAKRRAIEKGW